jgi:hypothetical protein
VKKEEGQSNGTGHMIQYGNKTDPNTSQKSPPLIRLVALKKAFWGD